MAEERKSVERVVLMEFEVGADELPADVQTDLQKQFGQGPSPEKLTILVKIGAGLGGPKQVIEEKARTRGRFRAVARESFDQGSEAIPPDQQKFELKPL